jgi:hypothetical protein
MSSGRKEATEGPTTSPFWSKSYAEFVMEKELHPCRGGQGGGRGNLPQEGEEGGLEETLPVGRPMTEREIDELSELLGYGIGSRAKRAREIDEMTFEDMKAEIRDQRDDQEEEESGFRTATDAAGTAHVPDGELGGRVHRL